MRGFIVVRHGLGAALSAALAITAATAATKKPAARRARPPVADTAPLPSTPPRTGILVPAAIQMKPLTPAEAEANAIWNLRAGLNVAALQCQYSPFLATVRVYNDLLKHHSAELASAQATMLGHFKRYEGAKGVNSFDQYTTKTYNSFSTLDAQYAFCVAAGEVGRGALMLPKGSFGKYALIQTPVLRTSLTPVPNSASLWAIDAQPQVLPEIGG